MKCLWRRLIIGPVSSIFDMTTFLIMWYFYQCYNDNPDNVIAFQTAWFLESLMTQVGTLYLLVACNVISLDGAWVE